MKYLHDIYRCVSCKSVAAHGNVFCRSCGIKFSPEDIAEMKANVHSTFGACPWNFRDTYRCTHCSEHICISDNYCRRCGDKIDDRKKQLMKLNMAELAKDNTPAVIGLLGFVAVVILILASAA